jgi:hypothetical protein
MKPDLIYLMVGIAVFDLVESARTEKVRQRNPQFVRDGLERRLLDLPACCLLSAVSFYQPRFFP